jgi:hypothetical protein
MRTCRLALAILAMLTTARALADGPKKALVLKTQLGGFIPDRELMQKTCDYVLRTRLERQQLEVLPAWKVFSADEQKCFDEACMRSLATEGRADVVVAAKVYSVGQQGNSFKVTSTVYVRDRTPTTTVITKECTFCSDDQVQTMVGATALEALEAKPSAAPPPDRPPLVSERPPIDPKHRALLYAVGGVGIATTVAGAVVLGVKVGQLHDPSCSSSLPADRTCPYRLDTTPGIGAGAAVAAVGVGVAITGFVLARRTYPRK